MAGGSYLPRLRVKDEWTVRGETYRLIDDGAGPRKLQEMIPQFAFKDGKDWREVRECFRWGILTYRIEMLKKGKA